MSERENMAQHLAATGHPLAAAVVRYGDELVVDVGGARLSELDAAVALEAGNVVAIAKPPEAGA